MLPARAAYLRLRPWAKAHQLNRRGLSTVPGGLQPFFQYAAECNITVAVQSAMEVTHGAGLTWVATIVGTGVVLRLATAPFHVLAERIFAKRLHATNFFTQKILEMLSKQYNVQVGANAANTALELKTSDERIAGIARETLTKSVNAALIDQNLKASRVQNLKMCSVPVWIFSSFALRNIISSDFHPSVAGGLWVPDLLVPDPYFILPVACGLTGFLNLWSQRKIYTAVGQPNTLAIKAYDAGLMFMTCFAVHIMSQMPACIPLFWLTASATGFAQAQLLRHPRVKKLFKINRLPTDSSTPIRDLFLLRRTAKLTE